MRDRPAWLRGFLGIFAWATVTAFAATGSWLGLSSVFATDMTATPTDTVLATDLPSPSSSSDSPSPSESSQSDNDDAVDVPQYPPDPEPTYSEPEPSESETEPVNGWLPIGDGWYERTFDTEGGTAVIQLSAEEAVFISASPAEGYTASRSNQSPTELVVTFDSIDDTVTVTAAWRDDAPQGEVATTVN